MTNRTRVFLAVAVGVLVAGLGTGLVASYMGLQGLAIIGGNGPDELAYVPADARLVGFADVRAVLNSELRQKFRELHPQTSPNGEFEQRTGINFENDIDAVTVAVLGMGNQRPLMVARGRFDEARIEGFIRESGGSVEDYAGKRLLLVPEKEGPSPAVTFPEPGLAMFGHVDAVRAALDTKRTGNNVTGTGDIITLVRDVDNSTVWAVGRFDALASERRVPQNVLEQLPPINLFAASGHINGGLQATLRVEARDDAAADDLREVVRGFIALARLQGGRNEQTRALLNSVELAGTGTSVALSVALPASALELLTPFIPRRQAETEPAPAPAP